MRIAIYDRYWTTRGGGERYAGVMAEVLSERAPVELLGPEPVSPSDLGDHLGLDLRRCHFRLVPGGSERCLVPITAEYDLFVNCTYLSRLPSAARRSVYVVLFPQGSWPAGLVEAARRLAPTGAPDPPPAVVPLDGFHPEDAGGSRWTRNRAALRVQPWAFRGDRARLRFGRPGPRTLGEALLQVQGPGVSWDVRGDELVLRRAAGSGDGPVDVELECRTFVPADEGISDDRRRLGLCLADPPVAAPGRRLGRLREKVEGKLDAHDASIPAAYDLRLSISEFTRRWVSKRWGVDSEVLAPPLDTDLFRAPDPSVKERVILSVGRFFHGSHNKKHLEMVRVFRRMCDRSEVPDGWEYHLVGNLNRTRLVDLEYFADLQRLAEGYPVRLMVDLGLDRLVDEYRRASIFWHAAGWGESERRRPEKFEHFGLTTCEAMASGCIPVVIAKAGQLEIVDHGRTGFLFRTARELEDFTRRLMAGHGEPWTLQLMRDAAADVQRFGHDAFEARLWEILEGRGLVT